MQADSVGVGVGKGEAWACVESERGEGVGWDEGEEELGRRVEAAGEAGSRSGASKEAGGIEGWRDGGGEEALEMGMEAAVPPVELRCPISLDIMADPVILASGQTYERHCIHAWLANGNTTCPNTGQTLPHLSLIPNYSVKAMIDLWCQRHGMAVPKPPQRLRSGSTSSSPQRRRRREQGLHVPSVPSVPSVPCEPARDARGGLPVALPGPKRVAPLRRARSAPVRYETLCSRSRRVGVANEEEQTCSSSQETLSANVRLSALQTGVTSASPFLPRSRSFVMEGEAQGGRATYWAHGNCESQSSSDDNLEGDRSIWKSTLTLHTEKIAKFVSKMQGRGANEEEEGGGGGCEMTSDNVRDERGNKCRGSSDAAASGKELSISDVACDVNAVEEDGRREAEDGGVFAEMGRRVKGDVSKDEACKAEMPELEKRKLLLSGAVCEELVGVQALGVGVDDAGCEETETGNLRECIQHVEHANKETLHALRLQLKETLKETVVERAAAEVRRLSKEEVKSRGLMGQQGIVDALIPLLTSSHQPTVEHAAAALVNLSIHVSNKALIMRAGAIPYLLELLTYGFAEAQEHSAAVLLSLSLVEDNRPALGATGAIPPLLRVVCTGNARARRDSAMALYSLSFFSLNRSKILKAGGVPILLALASDPATHSLHPHALRILAALSTSGEGRSALSCERNAEEVVRILKEHKKSACNTNTDSTIIDSTVAILYALAHPPSVNFSHRLRGLLTDPLVCNTLRSIIHEEGGSARVKEKASSLLKYAGEREGGGGSVFRRYSSEPSVVQAEDADMSRRSAEQLEDLTLHAKSLTDSQFFSMMDTFLDRNIVEAHKRGRGARKDR